MDKKKVKILQVGLDNITKKELFDKLEEFLSDGGHHQIVTVNPEFLLEAENNDHFQAVLNRSDLALADGFGIIMACLVKGHVLRRHTGADLVVDLLTVANDKQLKVGIINWQHSLSSSRDIQACLQQRWPNVIIKIIETDRDDWSPDLIDMASFQPDIVFCSLGAPFQDELLYQILPELQAKIGIGIGGSFDYLTGQAKRSPKVLRALGLEWTWRLFINPKLRAGRIVNAVIKFPWRFIIDDLIHPFFYRPNVVGFIYQGDEVLLVNSAEEAADYWKLPQGGRDGGEKVETAIRREMFEELGLEHIQITGVFPDIFQYRWPAGFSRQGYKGQRQTLCLINYSGPRDGIKLNWENSAYQWVKIDNLLNEVNPILQKSYGMFVEKYKLTLNV